MAIGDVTNPTIDPDGWTLQVETEGLTTGGAYTLGAASDEGGGTAKIFVETPGFDDNGDPITVQRTIYAGGCRDKIWPNHAQKDEAVASGKLVSRLHLRHWVYAEDIIVGAEFGLFVNDGSNSNTGVQLQIPPDAGANNSTRPYEMPPARWLSVGARVVAGILTVYAMAGHPSWRNSRPMRVMAFTATDGTTTRVVKATSITKVVHASGFVSPPYSASFDVSEFAQGATLEVNLKGYPWHGNKVIDSSRTTFLTSDADAPDLTVGETITQASTSATARVVSVTGSGPYTVTIDRVTGTPNGSNNWTGGTSGKVVTPDEEPLGSGFLFPSRNLGPLAFIVNHTGAYGEPMAYVNPNRRISTNSDFSGLLPDEQLIQNNTLATARVSRMVVVNAVDVTEVTGSPNGSDDWVGQTSSVSFTPTSTPATPMGNDGTGVVATVSSPTAAYANPFATIAAAATALAAYSNTNFSRNSVSNCVVQLSRGRHVAYGGTGASAVGNAQDAWFTITKRPENAIEDTRLVGTGLAYLLCRRTRFADIKIIQPNSGFFISAANDRDPMLFERCVVRGTNSNSNPLAVSATCFFLENDVEGVDHLGTYSTSGRIVTLVGNRIYNVNTLNYVRVVVGNDFRQRDNATSYVIFTDESDNYVWAHNRFRNANGGAYKIGAVGGPTLRHGVLEVCNIAEYTGSAEQPITEMFGSGAFPFARNIITGFVTLWGERSIRNYGSEGTQLRQSITEIFPVCELHAQKHERFDGNSTSTGSLEFAYSVGVFGGLSARSPDNFNAYYRDPTSLRATGNALGFVYDGSKVGANDGYGDYRLQANSMLRNRVPGSLVGWPCDLYGVDIPTDGTAAMGACQYPVSGGGGGPSRPRSRSRNEWTRGLLAA